MAASYREGGCRETKLFLFSFFTMLYNKSSAADGWHRRSCGRQTRQLRGSLGRPREAGKDKRTGERESFFYTESSVDFACLLITGGVSSFRGFWYCPTYYQYGSCSDILLVVMDTWITIQRTYTGVLFCGRSLVWLAAGVTRGIGWEQDL